MSDGDLVCALALIDEANGRDPGCDADGTPKALAYGRRMSRWLDRLAPAASDALRIAVRAQHIERWTVPRDSYPMDRIGYHRWRTGLQRMHGERAGAIARAAGYDAVTVGRVASLVRKEGIKRDAEAQALEDAACLSFLEDEFAAFATRYDDAKIVDIVRKTWAKMSPQGHALALELSTELPETARALIQRVLEGA
ncbi:MAG: DUF4202 domain-containing protein [Alphaproteobacteria bacterium]|nr:DUF4202 domain-containing protein [Alphaproteobacteria bacterium]